MTHGADTAKSPVSYTKPGHLRVPFDTHTLCCWLRNNVLDMCSVDMAAAMLHRPKEEAGHTKDIALDTRCIAWYPTGNDALG